MANSSMKALDRARQSVLIKPKADDRMNSERAGDVLLRRIQNTGVSILNAELSQLIARPGYSDS